MKKIFLSILLIITCVYYAGAGIKEKAVGPGICLGEPTGFSFKMWTGDEGAIDGLIGWSLRKGNRLFIRVNFLRHRFSEFKVKSGKLPFYYGIGTNFRETEDEDGDNENRIGINGLAGISYILKNHPIELYVEMGPVIDIIPQLEVTAIGGIGVRYYFDSF
ncbi:hypothetical protein ACFLUV_03220 [Elusimicrobiota bacterium]